MAGINFKGVQEVKDKTSTRPGTIGVFTVSDVTFGTTKNKATYYAGVTLSRAEDEFKHSFFLTENALGRFKTFIKSVSGEELDSEVSEEKIIFLLKGKEVAIKVSAKIDETNGRAYPDLSFGGFSKPVSRLSELAFTPKEQELIDKAKAIYASASSTDAPTSTPSSTTSVDEIF